jgi:hypothetical protein
MTEEAIDLETGEVLSGDAMVTGAIAQLNASEIDRQIATARAFPRELSKVRREIMGLVIQDDETAASMIYALPRGKEKNAATGNWEQKIVKGPTARFAEIVAYGWGNNRYGARIISEEEQFITAQGVFFDLEKNVSVTVEIKRRVTDKDGRRYNPDMIAMTCNAALSIAGRNAILKAVPKALWKGLYAAAEQTIKGDIQTLNDRRFKLTDQFKAFGMTPAMVCQVLGVGGSSEITLDHLGTLQGILTSLKDGETTVERLMSDSVGGDAAVAARGKETVEGIKRKYTAAPAASPAASPEVKAAAAAAQAKLEAKRARQPVAAMKPLIENPDAEPPEQHGLPMDKESW